MNVIGDHFLIGKSDISAVIGIEFRILSQVCLSLYQVFLDDIHGK